MVLDGWVHSRRDHGGVIFIDLRDRYGLTQIVFDPSYCADPHAIAEHLRREDVIEVKGEVKHRKENMENPNLATGKIEVFVRQLDVLNKAETPPIDIDDRIEANEDLRLKFRFLDLRRPVMQRNLAIRHKVANAARQYLNSQNFLEIETPLLVRATPEGARDYMVPSRVNPGMFYSLPQSPQLYKQILMASGCDRYYQIAKCLRDEDLRSDRQPEFTQIDIEMSFVKEEDIFALNENLMKAIMKEARGIDIKTPFMRIGYNECIERYGSDKPDLRFRLELTDVTDIAHRSEFNVFKNAELVKCINPEGEFSRKDIEEATELATQNGAKGLAWMRVTENGFESSIVKFFSQELLDELAAKIKPKQGSIIYFVADKKKTTNDVLAKLRNFLAEKMGLINKEEFKFAWVTDFPSFEWNEETESWDAAHHIFTMPKQECLQYLETEPGKVFAQCYDLTLNGVELASGSIRIHRSDIQERVMRVVGLTHAEAYQKFGFLLDAFKYGAPPHGGIGIGLDRLSVLLIGKNDIRDMIAFPKNKSAQCPMDGCPSPIGEKQLKELSIRLATQHKPQA